MMNKLKNKWWLFTILSGICLYLNPYFGLFSIVTVLILFFDIIYCILIKGHFNIFSKRIADKTEHNDTIKKVFSKEILFFKIGKLFTTVCMIFVILVIFINNIEIQKIMAPYYFLSIEQNFGIQVMLIVLAVASIIFSFILFWMYVDLYKLRLNELE
ncbi:hypothetical protein IGJ55_000152 [Enterococcus sp. AZ170]|uniref:hypothetical protein n=1 Tax=Enterococcus TaxID=1350 RepID=UPI001A92C7C6|nr:hypothetical protein [Enterococcus ureilyticus]MBO0447554.1 hypothetical protein [Enterococcus ureilyticus]